MPSGTLRFELDLDDPRPGDPPFRFATDREIHLDIELCMRCTTDVSVASTRFLRQLATVIDFRAALDRAG